MIQLLHPGPSLATVAVALLFLPIVAGGLPPLRETVLLAVSVALQQFAISVHNDWCDRALDALAKPHRPLPSGRISPSAALTTAALLAAGSLLLALPLGPDAVLLIALFMLWGALYNARLKRTFWSWLPFSLAFPLIPLFAAAALDRWPAWWPPTALAAQPLIVAIHLADSIPDLSSDTRAGAGGLATHLGPRLATRARNAGFALSAIALTVLALVSRA